MPSEALCETRLEGAVCVCARAVCCVCMCVGVWCVCGVWCVGVSVRACVGVCACSNRFVCSLYFPTPLQEYLHTTGLSVLLPRVAGHVTNPDQSCELLSTVDMDGRSTKKN